MDIEYRQEGDVVVAVVAGSLDTLTSPEAETSLNQKMDEGAVRFLIDFSNLDFISSAGLRVLLGLAKRQMKTGGKLHIVGMNATVRDVFAISGFDGIIQSSETLDTGLKAMNA